VPLNDDPSALSDADYWAAVDALRAAGDEAGEPVCDIAPPPDVVAAILVDLADAQDYRNDGPPHA